MLSARQLLAVSSWLFSFSVFALVGGYPVLPGRYPSVMMITGPDEVLGTGYCTAAKVAPEWILTAAHCVDDAYRTAHSRKATMKADIKAGTSLQYTFATQDIKGGETLTVTEVKLPPGTRPDVALIRVEPRGTFAEKPSSPLDLGDVMPTLYIELVGYGSEGEGDVAKRPARLTTHGAVVSTRDFLEQETMKIGTKKDELPPELHFFGVINWPGLAGHTNLGSGDSGGPVFISGLQTIVGVNSEGHCPEEKPNCQITNNSWFARFTSLPADWWPPEIRRQ